MPHCLLVDTKGMIVFMGHPACRNFENDFETLLKGEPITGEGTNAAGGSKDSA